MATGLPACSRSISWLIPVLLIGILASGCVSVGHSENPTNTAVVATRGTVLEKGSPSPAPVATTTVPAVPEIRPRQNLNVERGKIFAINGTVPDRSIREVQVWVLNGTVSTRRVPVNGDGTFLVSLTSSETALLPRTFSPALVIQYPSPPDTFTVNLDPVSGNITGSTATPPRILAELNNRNNYPTTLVDYLDQAITEYGGGNSCDIYFPNGVDAWIALNPVPPGPPATMTVSGTTSLPSGTRLSISVMTTFTHPTPRNYDSSHEFATGDAVVIPGNNGSNHFSGTIDTSHLNTGRYLVAVETGDESLQAYASEYAEIIAPVAPSPGTGNYINWSALGLPELIKNETMTPVMLTGEWKIVPPDTGRNNNDVPYGSIIDCATDGICRVFDQSGVQVLAVYDSNEAHGMEVPNGAMVDSGSIGNVTRIILDGKTILMKIDEAPVI